MADQKKPSVADILAKCKQLDAGESAAPSAETPPAAEPAPKASAPSVESVPAAPAKSGERPSVAEMMALARAGKKANGDTPGTETPAQPAAKSGERPSVAEMMALARAKKAGGAPEPVAQPAAVAPAAKAAAPKAAVAAKPAGPKDTGSILAAARGNKPGPITRAEAASRTAPAGKGEKAAVVVPPMPSKPVFAKPAAAPVVDEGRRLAIFSVLVGSFLALGFSTLAATFSIWTLGLARFMFPNILREPPSQFKVGFPGAFAPGMVEEKFKAQFGVWVVNGEYNGQQLIFALQSICTHLGCTPNWLEAEQKFKCPCHGSGFYKDGINFEGPAPRPLERYAIRIGDDGQLEIDKSRSFQQEMGGWEDPSSYVPV